MNGIKEVCTLFSVPDRGGHADREQRLPQTVGLRHDAGDDRPAVDPHRADSAGPGRGVLCHPGMAAAALVDRRKSLLLCGGLRCGPSTAVLPPMAPAGVQLLTIVPRW